MSEPLTKRLRAAAFAPMDIAGLAAFRFMFGLVMLIDFIRYWRAGWIDTQYVAPAFLFKYMGFEWVQPLPRVGMYAVFVVLMVASMGVMLGLLYRLSAWVLFIGHTYLFLLAATHYLNHAYLLSIVALLMAVVPAAQAASVDAMIRGGPRRSWTPAWAPWLLRLQLGMVYVYGGIAKINPDWLAGEPIRGWLSVRADSASDFFAELLRNEVVVGLVTQGGLWFDLLVAPALIWRRTRLLAIVVSAGFHLTNAYLFHIGVFPWFMLVATTLFFEPDWPRRLKNVGPVLKRWLGPVPEQVDPPRRPQRVLGLLVVWFAVQLVVPLRHHLYPGNVAWNEEGHYFSWRMKLRTKSGSARFVVYAPQTEQSWVVDPEEELTARQTRKMISKPELIRQYANHLAERWQREHGVEVEVRARVRVSLNRRREQQFIDPTVDLGSMPASIWPAEWIMPAPTEPVPRRRRR